MNFNTFKSKSNKTSPDNSKGLATKIYVGISYSLIGHCNGRADSVFHFKAQPENKK